MHVLIYANFSQTVSGFGATPASVSSLHAGPLESCEDQILRRKVACHVHSPAAQAKPKASSLRQERAQDASKATSVWNLAGWYLRALPLTAFGPFFPAVNVLQVC